MNATGANEAAFSPAVLVDANGFALSGNLELRATVERLDPAIDQIVPQRPVLQKVAMGFNWTEGPIWIRFGYLLFTDIPDNLNSNGISNSIRKLAKGGEVSIFQQFGATTKAGAGELKLGANGLTIDTQGRLTVAGNGARNVWRLESLSGPVRVTILADAFEGKRLNSPNDLVYRADGSLYFTDPPYGLTGEDKDPAKQLQVNGVYRIPGATQQKAGALPQRRLLQLLLTDLPRPNGIAFSPDEKYFYVDNSEPKKFWMRYRVKPDGTLTDGQLFFDATSDTRPGLPDGMKVDTAGNVYSAGPAGIWIFSPTGKHLGTIVIPEQVGNLHWGDGDGRTLYITASTSVYRIRLKSTGVRPKLQ